MYRLEAQERLVPLWPEWERVQRQDLPALYYRNGAIYTTRRSTLVLSREVMGAQPLAYEMPSRWLVNIDDERDLLLAETLAQHWASAG
jgi:N-acylneuraminate cytidylyltransferase